MLAIDLAITAGALYVVARFIVARIHLNSIDRIGIAGLVAALMLAAPSLFKLTGVLEAPWWEVVVLSLTIGAFGYLYFFVRAPAIIKRVRRSEPHDPEYRP